MSSVSRLNDSGSGNCCCHSDPPCINVSGIIITAAPSTNVGGPQMARYGDVVLGYCGHVGVIVSTMVTTTPGVARIGDLFVGCYAGVLVTGAPTTIGGR